MAEFEYATLRTEMRGAVGLVTFTRPDAMNAFTVRMGAEIADALLAFDAADDCRAVVLTGEGRAFCAGAALDAGGDAFGSYVERAEAAGPPHRPMDPWRLRKPVIAAMSGHAVGVGLTMAMQCDVRFAAADAKYAFAFVRRGIVPELASHVIVPHAVGMSRAAELLLSGRTISGTEAAEMGLVSRALPADEVLAAAIELADDIARYTAPLSVARSKRLLWRALEPSIDEMAKLESVEFARASKHADSVEGVKSFIEKRDPVWTGRPSTELDD